MVFKDDDGTFYMYYCTSIKSGGARSLNAIGVAVSRDLVSWEDRGAFTLKNVDHYAESPFVVKRNGVYYMFYTRTGAGEGTGYATSYNPVTGFSVPDDDRNMLIPGANASEVLEFKGKWYITAASPRVGGQQYLELWEFFWNDDGTVSVGKKVK